MKPRQFYRTYPRNVYIFVTGPVFLTMPLMHLQQRCSFTVFILSVYTCTCNDKCVHCPLLQPCNTVGVRSAVALIYLYLTIGKGYYGYAVFVVIFVVSLRFDPLRRNFLGGQFNLIYKYRISCAS